MKIVLASGREIGLSRLQQGRTYAGMLNGFFDARVNQHEIDQLLEEARELAVVDCEPFLIQPAPAITELPSGRMQEKLPPITCVADFRSNELNRAGSEPYSSLAVAWFQDEFAMPIDTEVLNQIRKIDWERHAKDWNW
jgi:hypothetical protein